jgi:hypothetical protein
MVDPWIRPFIVGMTGLAAIAAGMRALADRVDSTPPARLPSKMAADIALHPASPAANEHNPAVSPGLVRWHPSFSDAQAAAHRSGKPVLLFHMMGRLDRQFC